MGVQHAGAQLLMKTAMWGDGTTEQRSMNTAEPEASAE